MTRSQVKLSLAALALLTCAIPLAADIPFLWLDSPSSRSNPNDPKSPLFMTATRQPTAPSAPAVPTTTPTISPTPSVTATATSSRTPSPSPSATPVIADIVDVGLTWSPSSLTVSAGSTVTWAWSGFHSVLSTTGSEPYSSGAGTLGGVFSHTFNTPGTFTYQCNVHGASMSGTIFVPAPNTFTSTPSPNDTATPSCTPSASPTPAINGIWPILSNFEGDEFGNTALGTNFSFDDNGDGCGASGSTTSFSRVVGTSWDGSACLRYDYTVATNAGCGYQYAAFAMPLVSPQDISAYNGFRFYVKGAVGGETFRIKITTGAFADPCNTLRNIMFVDYSATTTSWQLVQIPFSAFTPQYPGCLYLPTMASHTENVQFVVQNVGSGTVYIDEPGFMVMPTNGVWPVVTNFEGDVMNNNDGGMQFDGNDNEEGCGPSLSADGWSWVASGSWDGSAYGSLTYTVDTNVGCGYQYMYFGFGLSTQQDLSGFTGVRFYARDSNANSVKVQLSGNAADACIGGRNRLLYNPLAITTSWAQYDLPFSSFVDANGGCSFVGGGWMTQVGDLSFVITAVSAGTFDFDLVEFY